MTDRTQPIGSDDLNAFVDGSLALGDQHRIRTAVSVDSAAQAELTDLQAIRSLLSGLPEARPRRSFTLGPEHATNKPAAIAPIQGKLLHILPIMRTLSVAAVLLFLVVGGSLWMGANSQTTNTSTQDFAIQNENMAAISETNGNGHSSESAEDALPAPASANGSEPNSSDDESLTSRGDSASADDRPSDVEEAPAQKEQDVSSFSAKDFSLADHAAWVWATIVIGALATAMTLVWLLLDRTARQTHPIRR